MLRSEIPRISAACHQLIRLAIARKITSCTFIARSQADSEYPLTPASFPGRELYPVPPSADRSRANCTGHLMRDDSAAARGLTIPFNWRSTSIPGRSRSCGSRTRREEMADIKLTDNFGLSVDVIPTVDSGFLKYFKTLPSLQALGANIGALQQLPLKEVQFESGSVGLRFQEPVAIGTDRDGFDDWSRALRDPWHLQGRPLFSDGDFGRPYRDIS